MEHDMSIIYIFLNQEEARKRRSPSKRICYGIKEERKDGAWDGQTQKGAELLGCDAPSMIEPTDTKKICRQTEGE